MKRRILNIAFVLLIMASSIVAQESKKIHLKLIKDVNGEKTVVDTIIEGDNAHDYLFYTLDDKGKINVDSLLKELNISQKE